MTKVVVTGVGVVSSLGIGFDANIEALRSGRHAIRRATIFDSKFTELLPFAEVNCTDNELKEIINDGVLKSYTRTTLLARIALTEAIQSAQLTTNILQEIRTGFISASTVGGMCLTDQLYHEANAGIEPSEFVGEYGGFAHTLLLAKDLGIKGYTNTLNTACSSSANAIMLGARLIKSGRLDRVIVGGVDCLSKYTANGFNALKILSPEPCRPFDKNRMGLNLGEAAAYLVLEAEEKTIGKVWGRIEGYGNTNDAYHASALSEQAYGAVGSMQEALLNAQLTAAEIDYINTHGTGTENNDAVELHAMKQVFTTIPLFSSTKSFTGHTLGAAGALEAVFSLGALQYQEVYPNLSFQTPEEPFSELPQLTYQAEKSIRYVLSNSFGFGGNCTSLIFGKV